MLAQNQISHHQDRRTPVVEEMLDLFLFIGELVSFVEISICTEENIRLNQADNKLFQYPTLVACRQIMRAN